MSPDYPKKLLSVNLLEVFKLQGVRCGSSNRDVAQWLAHLLWEQKTAGSSPVIPTGSGGNLLGRGDFHPTLFVWHAEFVTISYAEYGAQADAQIEALSDALAAAQVQIKDLKRDKDQLDARITALSEQLLAANLRIGELQSP